MSLRISPPFALAVLLVPALLLAEPLVAQDDAKAPKNVNQAEAPGIALKRFAVAPGLKVDLWASEPLIENVVALSFDEKGRAFVVETHRRRTSVPDIRKHVADWLIPDLALRTTADRIAFLKKMNPSETQRKPDTEHPDFNGDGQFDWRDFTVESERIKRVEDRAGKGVADTSSVFAEGFNKLETGVAAGVLARGKNVWFACIPDIWRLEGADHPTATSKEAILTGFGVHVAYSGHDMHGMKMGPDGKIYWSIADCGAHVKTKEGQIVDMPDAGAVYRANPDGTEMELYAWGLRNPQSLAFNDVGDLFTGDNNADQGDRARWIHVVEGADYGWRMGWQFLPYLGAWNSELMWQLDAGSTNLSILPPVGHVGHGPAGIAYYPGTGLPESYREHFFYADFPGGVRSFSIRPSGVSYTIDNPNDVHLDNSPREMTDKLLWGLYPSDVQFGVDGGAYVLDWVYGWEKTGKGRIFRVHDPVTDASAIVIETKKILGEGMEKRTEEELGALLTHPDQRVRVGAEFALVERGPAGLETLSKYAQGLAAPGPAGHNPRLARLHAIWGLEQLARKHPEALAPIALLLRDADSEVRAQAAKAVGDLHAALVGPALLPLLQDTAPRPRFFAAMALGKLGVRFPVEDLLSGEYASDPFLRHAAAFALTRMSGPHTLHFQGAPEPVRAAELVACRRMHSQDIIFYLQDSNPQFVLEAARAIHDEPIPAAMDALAEQLPRPDLARPVVLRVINANYILGKFYAAKRLGDLAVNAAATEENRLDALDALATWNEDLGRDRIVGLWRPLPPGRDPQAAIAVASEILPQILKAGSEPLRIAAVEMAGRLKAAATEPVLFATANDIQASGKLRAAALRALAALASPRLGDALALALKDSDKSLLQEARKISAKTSPNDAVEQSAAVMETGSIAEKQSALQTLATLADHEADKLIARWLDRLPKGKVPPALELELLEAASHRTDARVKEKLAAWEAARDPADLLGQWRECLEGGDAQAGGTIFREKAEAACMRCHKMRGEGGDVGPDLAGIGSRHDRKYILTSIISPNADIAPGYENVLVTLKDGNLVMGIASAETADELILTPITGGEKQHVKKAQIAKREKAPSPMPEGLGLVLGKRDLRNMVEFLATSK